MQRSVEAPPGRDGVTRAPALLRRARRAAGLLALALLASPVLLPPAPAQAQTSVSVSNITQTAGKARQFVSSSSHRTNRFTTGGSGSDRYTLTSVVLDVDNDGSGQLVVSIHRPHHLYDVLPGDRIGNNLTGAIDSDAGRTTYTPGAGNTITLHGGARYFVRVGGTGSARRWIQSASSDAEDSGSTTGWSIHNVARLSNDGGRFWSNVSRGRSLLFTVNATAPAPTLTPSAITNNSATLTRSNHTGTWYYKANALPHTACSSAQSGNSVNLTGLRAGTSYTYKAYSNATCATELTSAATDAEFRTAASASTALSADRITQTGARLQIANRTGSWHYKSTASGASCSPARTGAFATVRGLAPGTSYTYKAYSDSGCATEITSGTTDAEFMTLAPATLSADRVTLTGARLTIAGYSGAWHLKANTGPDRTCSSTAVTGTTATLGGLSASTSYTYKAYADSGCAEEVTSAATDAEFMTPAAPGVEIGESALRVPEGGTATYTVKLKAAPAHPVTVTVSRASGSDPDLTADTDAAMPGNQSTLTFSTTDWGTARTVTVSAAEDADLAHGRATFTHAASSTDPGYGASLAIASVTATEADNDPGPDPYAPGTVWSSVLTANDAYGDRGCDNLDGTFGNCSDERVLSDDKFDYANTTYPAFGPRGPLLRVRSLFRAGNWLYFRTDRALPGAMLERGALTVDGVRLTFSRFARVFQSNATYLRVSNPGFGWYDGQRVSLSIAVPAPPPPPPGQVWWSTLTVDESSGDHGCDNLDSGWDNCSAALSTDTVRYDGASYRIVRLYRGGNYLYLRTDRTLPDAIRQRGTLTVDGRRLAFSGFARVFAGNPRWLRFADPGFAWSDNQTVTLSIAARAWLPTHLRAEPGDGRVTLRWNAVDEARGYQYRYTHEVRGVPERQRIRSSGWQWFPGSYGGDESGAVAGLTNGTEYTFQVRAMTRNPDVDHIAWVGGRPSGAVSATPAGPPPDACGGRLTGDGSVTGRWAPGCESAKRTGSLARYYRFTLADESRVTLDLRSGDADSYLYLWSGDRRTGGTPLAEDNDGGSGGDARIVRTLDAGTYTVEATTFATIGETGRFTLTASGLGHTAPAPSQVTGLAAEAGDGEVRLRWDAMDGLTGWEVERDGNGAWTGAGEGSATGHTVTGLAGGGTYRFRVRAVNDAGPGPPSAPVTVTLAAPLESGCVERLAGDGAVAGRWAPGCGSAERRGRHARFYEFALAERRAVTVDLRSGAADPYLYLRAGARQRPGGVIARDDDGGSGYDARIARTLDAGTYTVEATTYGRGETGAFTLTLGGTGGGGGTTGPPDDGTPPPPAAEPALRVSDARADEGSPYDSGELRFTVTLSPAAGHEVSVDYRTRDGTAQGDLYGRYGDYEETYGRLRFAPGETSKTVPVRLIGDWHDEGDETLFLVLSNASGAAIADGEGVGTIVNSDPIPKAWTARFGRTVADQVIGAVEGRMQADRAPGAEVSLAGERIGLAPLFGAESEDDAEAARERAEARKEDEAQREALRLAEWLKGGTDPDGLEQAWAGGAGAGPAGRDRAMAARELLLGSSFALTAETAGGGSAAFWGRGAVTRFDGRADELALDGEVATALLGADWSPGSGPGQAGRATMGLILGHSRGEGGYRDAAGGGGTVASTLTGLYPWGRYALSERVSVWGVAGWGEGTLSLTPENADPGSGPEQAGERQPVLRADLELMMGALGLRGTLLDPGSGSPGSGPGQAGTGGGLFDGFTLTGKADAMAVRTSTGRGRGADGGTLASSEAVVTRLRLGLEASRPVALDSDGATLTPSLEVGVRHDGGDAETGFGVDLGGGLAFADPGLGIEAEIRARGLLTHEADGFRERGLSGALNWRQRPGTDRGAMLSLTQTVGGAASGGADALLGRTTLQGLAADNGDDLRARRLEVRLGYGFSAFSGRFTLTPEAGAGFADSGRDWRLGLRLAPAGNAGALELSFEALRREAANDPGSGSGAGAAEHEAGFRATARW